MSWLLYAVLLAPLTMAAVTWLSGSTRHGRYIHLAGSTAVSLLLLWLVQTVYAGGALRDGMLYVDYLSVVLLAVVAVLTFTASLFSTSYMEKDELAVRDAGALRRYYTLFHLFTFTMIGVLTVENLGLMWVAVEATTLASALLVAFYFNRSAVEAAWKYVMVCTVGICLALLGTILLYYAQVSAGAANSEALSWLALMQMADRLDPAMLKLACVFIVIGYGTKAGLAPMHTWLPDAHSQAPSPVSGLLSGALLSCALYAIMRNLAVLQATPSGDFARQLLLALGLLSVAIAIPFLLVQHDLKRLLAYSSVENIGLAAVALGLGTPLAAYGALLHIVNHAVAKSALFFLAGIVTQEYHTRHIARIKGLLATMPAAGTLLVLLFLIITGTPPFGVFVGKFVIALGAFAAGYRLLGGVLLLLLSGVFAGMMYYCFGMAFGPAAASPRTGKVGKPALAALLLSVAILTVTGLYVPECLDAVLWQAAAVITGG